MIPFSVPSQPMSGKTKIQLYLVFSFVYTNLACRSSSVSLSLLCLPRSLLLSLSYLFSSSWTLLAMVSPSWHSEYSSLSFKCFILVHRNLSFTIRMRDVPMTYPLTVHRILSFTTICTRDVPLSIVLYRLPPVDYTRRSNDVPLYFIIHHPDTRHSNSVPSTTNQCGARSGSPQ